MRVANQRDSIFRTNIRALGKLVRSGGTLSGHERNCAFLNTHSGRFATISAVSGLDFADDARTHALVDWDQDGDLDLWTANRTAPRIRLLRNDTPTDNHFLTLRLEGRQANRDAIGARVRVLFQDATAPPLIKTLRAGEGYLGQSSKWLHFGLGATGNVKHLLVDWPGGKSETIRGVVPDRFYRIVEGSGTAAQWQPPQRQLALVASDPAMPPPSNRAQTLLTSRVPLPPLDYHDFDGRKISLTEQIDQPLLINLWASWCGPCLVELKQFTIHQQTLRAAGLNIVAISVDGLGEKQTTSPEDAAQLLKRLAFPFDQGTATQSLIDKLQSVFEFPFRQEIPMPVPVSFLIDSQGQVAAIYRGPVDVERLLGDVRKLPLRGTVLLSSALPLPGRWIDPPREPSLMRVALDLMDKGYVDDALAYVRGNQPRLARHKEYPKLLVWLGNALFQRGDAAVGLAQFREALEMAPDNMLVMNNLAWQLAAHGDAQVRDGAQAVHWAERAADLTQHQNPTVLDTLAAAYAEAGRFDDAVRTIQDALRLATKADETQLTKQLRQRLDLYKAEQPYRDPPP